MSDIESGRDFIEHYGAKGMKWGVRKSRNEAARKEQFRRNSSKDARNVNKIQTTAKSKGTNALSNEKLQVAINRMNLEVNYSRLSEQTRKKSFSEKAVQFLVKDVAEVEVKRVVKAQSTIEVNKALLKYENRSKKKD